MNHFIQFLTYFRIFIAPVIFLLLIHDYFGWTLFLFLLASISDYWDGFLARKYMHTSEIGEILDPIADKILLVFLLIGISVLTDSIFVTLISCILISREFWVSGLRDLNSRKNNISATKVTFTAKLKTATQFLAIFLFLLGFYTKSTLIVFIANFVLFLSLILSIQSGMRYTLESLRK